MNVHEQRQRTISVLSAVITLIVVGAFLTFDQGPMGTRFRSLIGKDGRLNPTVQTEGAPGGHYQFLRTQPGSDEPVSWNPCKEIHYVINPEGAPEGWESMITEAVAEVEDRTGLEFAYDGTSEDRNFTDRYASNQQQRPVLIGWSDSDEEPALKGDVAGLGGATAAGINNHVAYVTGMVILDTDVFDRLDNNEGRPYARAIVLHELGHVVGLDHVDDKGEIMYADGGTRTTYGAGDLKGLARLGAVSCF